MKGQSAHRAFSKLGRPQSNSLPISKRLPSLFPAIPGVAEPNCNVWKVPNLLEDTNILRQEQAEPGKLWAVIHTYLREQQHLQQVVFQEPGIALYFPAVFFMLDCSTPGCPAPHHPSLRLGPRCSVFPLYFCSHPTHI